MNKAKKTLCGSCLLWRTVFGHSSRLESCQKCDLIPFDGIKLRPLDQVQRLGTLTEQNRTIDRLIVVSSTHFYPILLDIINHWLHGQETNETTVTLLNMGSPVGRTSQYVQRLRQPLPNGVKYVSVFCLCFLFFHLSICLYLYLCIFFLNLAWRTRRLLKLKVNAPFDLGL